MKRSSASPSEHPDLSQITSLEAKLKSILATKTSSTEAQAEASSVRMELCETFSSILIDHTHLALRKDIPGRLWNNCFYTEIQTLRSRIAKAKRNNDPEKVKKDQKVFDKFLKEAIILYDFLIDQFRGKLLPDATQSPSQSQRQKSQTIHNQNSPHSHYYSSSSQLSSSSSHRETHDAVIVLYRLYIYLGDLHRYRAVNTKAETAYTHASNLAPGKGNPYNQLAVMAQLKSTDDNPNNLTAMYWYIRSLGAYDVFETSKGNLGRLIGTNEKWMKGHGKKAGLTLGKGELNAYLDAMDSKDDVKTKKAWATRIVLSQFVEYIGMVLKVEDSDQVEQISLKGQELISALDEVLDLNPFGDKLLVQLIAILAYAIVGHGDYHLKAWCVETLLGFVYQFASTLCKYFDPILEKAEQKLIDGNKQPSMRLLGPLLLISELISECESTIDHSNDDVRQVKMDFWERIASIAEKITFSSHLMQELEKDAQVLALEMPDDFVSLSLGFKPFAFLGHLSSGMGTEDHNKINRFVSADQAIEVLGLNSIEPSQSQLSQKSKKTTTSADTSKSDSENKIKLARFMAFVSKSMDDKKLVCDGNKSIRVNHESLSVQGDSPTEKGLEFEPEDTNDRETENDLGEDTEMDSPTKEAGDLLVYKSSGDGGPALLVPGAMLLQAADDVDSSKCQQDKPITVKSPIDDEAENPKTNESIYPSSTKADDLCNESVKIHDGLTESFPNTNQTYAMMGETLIDSVSAVPPTTTNMPVSSARIKPPPGFGSLSMPPISNQQQEHQNSNDNAIDVSVITSQQDMMSTIPPGFGSQLVQPHPSFLTLPNTKNPFVTTFHQSNLHNLGTLHAQPQSNPDDSFASDFDLDDDDRFGLKCLGIFGDPSPTVPSATSTGMSNLTRNPFT